MKQKKKLWRGTVLPALVFFLCLFFAGVNRQYLKEGLADRYFLLELPSAGTVDATGGVYVIDHSKQRVAAFTREGNYRYQILGGRRDGRTFYSAVDLKADDEGNLYLLDNVLAVDGSAIEKERIVKFSKEGKYLSTVYEITYAAENRPVTTGRIHEITLEKGGLKFVFSEPQHISLVRLQFHDGSTEVIRQMNYDTKYLLSYGIDVSENRIYAVTKMADILEIYDDGAATVVYEGERHDTEEFFSIPWETAVSASGRLYFTDIGLRQVGFMDPDGTTGTAVSRTDQKSLCDSRIFYNLDVSQNGELTAIADEGVYVKQPMEESAPVVYGAGDGMRPIVYPAGYIGLRITVYGAVLLAGICLFFFLRQVLRLKVKIAFSEITRNNLLIVTVAVIIAVVTVSTVMEGLQKQYQLQVMNNMSSIAELACKSLDAEAVEQINTPRDYISRAYKKVRNSIEDSFSTSNGWNEGLYCVLNRVNENKLIYSCLYLEDTIGSVYPLDYNYEESEVYRAVSDSGFGSEYKELYETGRQIRFDWIENADGIWTYVLSPVVNREGKVVAAMEVGTNLYAFQEANNIMLRNMIFNIISIIAVIILVFTELSFLWFYRGLHRREVSMAPDPAKKSLELAVYVIRPIAFLIFMADCMATAFLPMLASQLAVPFLGISEKVMSAVPISVEVLLTAMFSFAGGFLIERMGFRRILLGGGALFTAGLLLAGTSASFFQFVGAKAVIGIGMGLLLVGINTLAASFPEKESAEGFSFYNSGSLAGLTVGTTIGSLLAAPLGYLRVYYVAAVISLAALVVMFLLLKKDMIYPELRREKEQEEEQITMVRFLFRKDLLLFFFCAMIPYMLYGYFLNYFLPLYAEGQGMTETAIGQLFLMNGICVIYLGPSLTAFVLKKLKARWSVWAAGLIYVITLLLFFVFMGKGMVVAAAFFFGIADSFGFSALSIYYSGLDVVKTYGNGRAMGVYSTFDNISQTAGPFVFSAVFVIGVRKGVLLLAAVYLVLLVMFAVHRPANKPR